MRLLRERRGTAGFYGRAECWAGYKVSLISQSALISSGERNPNSSDRLQADAVGVPLTSDVQGCHRGEANSRLFVGREGLLAPILPT